MSPDEAYQQGMADYEAAMVAHAQEGSASPEAYYHQGLMDYEQALLEQAAAADAAGGDAEAHYWQGISDYETLLLQTLEAEEAAASHAAAHGTDEEEAYTLGLLHRESELTTAALDEAVKNLSASQRTAYESARSDFDSALEAEQPGQPSADAGEQGNKVGAKRGRGRKRAG
jgi:hypothetical protein